MEVQTIVSHPDGMGRVAQQLQSIYDHPAVAASPQHMDGINRHWFLKAVEG